MMQPTHHSQFYESMTERGVLSVAKKLKRLDLLLEHSPNRVNLLIVLETSGHTC